MTQYNWGYIISKLMYCFTVKKDLW